MATAKKLPSGNYRVQATRVVDGKRNVKSFTASTAAQAERLASEWQKHIDMVGTDSTTLTVEQAINEYIDMKSNVLSASTILAYRRYLSNGYSDIKHLKLYQLTSVVIQKSINLHSTSLSPKSLKNYYGLLIATLKMFYPELTLSLTFPQKPKQQKRRWTKDYLRDLLKAIENSSIEIPALLAMMLSMRASEIAGLKWSDVDLDNRTINIHRSRVNSPNGWVYKELPKNENSNRVAFIPDTLLEKLKKFKKQNNANDDDYLITTKPNQFWRMLGRKTEKAGIEPIRFHDLRHINASIMLSLGINNQIAQEIGGWSTDNIMKSVYQHTFSEERIEANIAMNNYFNNL